MANDHGDEFPDAFDLDADDDDVDLADLKEAFGLPDSLPPIRLPSLPELAAQARKAPLTAQLAALAAWAEADGPEVTDDGLPTPAGASSAAAAAGVSVESLDYLWEYACGVEWLVFDEEDELRALPGDTAREWAADDDESVFDAWSSTLAAVVGDTLELAGPGDDDDWEELGFEDVDFGGQPMALVILLFLARREGLSVADFTEVLWESACGDMPAREAAAARAKWLSMYGDPARLLLDKLAELHAVTESGGIVRLTPLTLAAIHEQLTDAGVDIPLLPATAAELTAAQLLAMAEGTGDEEFEAEADAWFAARQADEGARELLGIAAAGDPGERVLAVAAVTRVGAAAGQAWRDSLDVPELRPYAKVALAALAAGPEGAGGASGASGEGVPPELELEPFEVAWLTTDMLALACDDEFPDPEEIAATLSEAVPAGKEPVVFDTMWRGPHPDALDVLVHIGKYHPDKAVAKAARTAAHKAAGRRGSPGA